MGRRRGSRGDPRVEHLVVQRPAFSKPRALVSATQAAGSEEEILAAALRDYTEARDLQGILQVTALQAQHRGDVARSRARQAADDGRLQDALSEERAASKHYDRAASLDTYTSRLTSGATKPQESPLVLNLDMRLDLLWQFRTRLTKLCEDRVDELRERAALSAKAAAAQDHPATAAEEALRCIREAKKLTMKKHTAKELDDLERKLHHLLQASNKNKAPKKDPVVSKAAQRLLEAARRGDAGAIDQVLLRTTSPAIFHIRDDSGRTALECALTALSTGAVEKILAHSSPDDGALRLAIQLHKGTPSRAATTNLHLVSAALLQSHASLPLEALVTHLNDILDVVLNDEDQQRIIDRLGLVDALAGALQRAHKKKSSHLLPKLIALTTRLLGEGPITSRKNTSSEKLLDPFVAGGLDLARSSNDDLDFEPILGALEILIQDGARSLKTAELVTLALPRVPTALSMLRDLVTNGLPARALVNLFPKVFDVSNEDLYEDACSLAADATDATTAAALIDQGAGAFACRVLGLSASQNAATLVSRLLLHGADDADADLSTIIADLALIMENRASILYQAGIVPALAAVLNVPENITTGIARALRALVALTTEDGRVHPGTRAVAGDVMVLRLAGALRADVATEVKIEIVAVLGDLIERGLGAQLTRAAQLLPALCTVTFQGSDDDTIKEATGAVLRSLLENQEDRGGIAVRITTCVEPGILLRATVAAAKRGNWGELTSIAGLAAAQMDADDGVFKRFTKDGAVQLLLEALQIGADAGMIDVLVPILDALLPLTRMKGAAYVFYSHHVTASVTDLLRGASASSQFFKTAHRLLVRLLEAEPVLPDSVQTSGTRSVREITGTGPKMLDTSTAATVDSVTKALAPEFMETSVSAVVAALRSRNGHLRPKTAVAAFKCFATVDVSVLADGALDAAIAVMDDHSRIPDVQCVASDLAEKIAENKATKDDYSDDYSGDDYETQEEPEKQEDIAGHFVEAGIVDALAEIYVVHGQPVLEATSPTTSRVKPVTGKKENALKAASKALLAFCDAGHAASVAAGGLDAALRVVRRQAASPAVIFDIFSIIESILRCDAVTPAVLADHFAIGETIVAAIQALCRQSLERQRPDKVEDTDAPLEKVIEGDVQAIITVGSLVGPLVSCPRATWILHHHAVVPTLLDALDKAGTYDQHHKMPPVCRRALSTLMDLLRKVGLTMVSGTSSVLEVAPHPSTTGKRRKPQRPFSAVVSRSQKKSSENRRRRRPHTALVTTRAEHRRRNDDEKITEAEARDAVVTEVMLALFKLVRDGRDAKYALLNDGFVDIVTILERCQAPSPCCALSALELFFEAVKTLGLQINPRRTVQSDAEKLRLKVFEMEFRVSTLTTMFMRLYGHDLSVQKYGAAVVRCIVATRGKSLMKSPDDAADPVLVCIRNIHENLGNAETSFEVREDALLAATEALSFFAVDPESLDFVASSDVLDAVLGTLHRLPHAERHAAKAMALLNHVLTGLSEEAILTSIPLPAALRWANAGMAVAKSSRGHRQLQLLGCAVLTRLVHVFPLLCVSLCLNRTLTMVLWAHLALEDSDHDVSLAVIDLAVALMNAATSGTKANDDDLRLVLLRPPENEDDDVGDAVAMQRSKANLESIECILVLNKSTPAIRHADTVESRDHKTRCAKSATQAAARALAFVAETTEQTFIGETSQMALRLLIELARGGRGGLFASWLEPDGIPALKGALVRAVTSGDAAALIDVADVISSFVVSGGPDAARSFLAAATDEEVGSPPRLLVQALQAHILDLPTVFHLLKLHCTLASNGGAPDLLNAGLGSALYETLELAERTHPDALALATASLVLLSRLQLGESDDTPRPVIAKNADAAVLALTIGETCTSADDAQAVVYAGAALIKQRFQQHQVDRVDMFHKRGMLEKLVTLFRRKHLMMKNDDSLHAAKKKRAKLALECFTNTDHEFDDTRALWDAFTTAVSMERSQKSLSKTELSALDDALAAVTNGMEEVLRIVEPVSLCSLELQDQLKEAPDDVAAYFERIAALKTLAKALTSKPYLPQFSVRVLHLMYAHRAALNTRPLAKRRRFFVGGLMFEDVQVEAEAVLRHSVQATVGTMVACGSEEVLQAAAACFLAEVVVIDCVSVAGLHAFGSSGAPEALAAALRRHSPTSPRVRFLATRAFAKFVANHKILGEATVPEGMSTEAFVLDKMRNDDGLASAMDTWRLAHDDEDAVKKPHTTARQVELRANAAARRVLGEVLALCKDDGGPSDDDMTTDDDSQVSQTTPKDAGKAWVLKAGAVTSLAVALQGACKSCLDHLCDASHTRTPLGDDDDADEHKAMDLDNVHKCGHKCAEILIDLFCLTIGCNAILGLDATSELLDRGAAEAIVDFIRTSTPHAMNAKSTIVSNLEAAEETRRTSSVTVNTAVNNAFRNKSMMQHLEHNDSQTPKAEDTSGAASPSQQKRRGSPLANLGDTLRRASQSHRVSQSRRFTDSLDAPPPTTDDEAASKAATAFRRRSQQQSSRRLTFESLLGPRGLPMTQTPTDWRQQIVLAPTHEDNDLLVDQIVRIAASTAEGGLEAKTGDDLALALVALGCAAFGLLASSSSSVIDLEKRGAMTAVTHAAMKCCNRFGDVVVRGAVGFLARSIIVLSNTQQQQQSSEADATLARILREVTKIVHEAVQKRETAIFNNLFGGRNFFDNSDGLKAACATLAGAPSSWPHAVDALLDFGLDLVDASKHGEHGQDVEIVRWLLRCGVSRVSAQVLLQDDKAAAKKSITILRNLAPTFVAFHEEVTIDLRTSEDVSPGLFEFLRSLLHALGPHTDEVIVTMAVDALERVVCPSHEKPRVSLTTLVHNDISTTLAKHHALDILAATYKRWPNDPKIAGPTVALYAHILPTWATQSDGKTQLNDVGSTVLDMIRRFAQNLATLKELGAAVQAFTTIVSAAASNHDVVPSSAISPSLRNKVVGDVEALFALPDVASTLIAACRLFLLAKEPLALNHVLTALRTLCVSFDFADAAYANGLHTVCLEACRMPTRSRSVMTQAVGLVTRLFIIFRDAETSAEKLTAIVMIMADLAGDGDPHSGFGQQDTASIADSMSMDVSSSEAAVPSSMEIKMQSIYDQVTSKATLRELTRARRHPNIAALAPACLALLEQTSPSRAVEALPLLGRFVQFGTATDAGLALSLIRRILTSCSVTPATLVAAELPTAIARRCDADGSISTMWDLLLDEVEVLEILLLEKAPACSEDIFTSALKAYVTLLDGPVVKRRTKVDEVATVARRYLAAVRGTTLIRAYLTKQKKAILIDAGIVAKMVQCMMACGRLESEDPLYDDKLYRQKVADAVQLLCKLAAAADGKILDDDILAVLTSSLRRFLDIGRAPKSPEIRGTIDLIAGQLE